MHWLAPEIVKGQPYSKEIDIWSFGALAHELASGQPPFQQFIIGNRCNIYHAIVSKEVPFVADRSTEFNDLISKCLKKDNSQRLTIAEVLKHEFLRDAPTHKQRWKDDYLQFKDRLSDRED